ncbi:MAG: protein kinase, partial [Planctomycetota bacterium]|nr:protein kinase [Planctomycetota bacterium]
GEADGFLYYVMPFVKGESLRERLARQGELPIADAVKILREIVDALTHAHEQGVVHRDIKPDNVMLSGRHALVTDFGVAKAVSEATGRAKLTTAGVALGTPAYMAPEQATADPTMDHRADIYAVGAVGYEMLTGRPPFTGTTPQMILAAHVTEAPAPVTKYRETVPPALAQLVMKCLEKKPADRWQSAEQLLPQLEVLATSSGGMTPTGTQQVISSGTESAIRQAHPVRVAGLFGAASAVVLGLVYLIMIQLGLPDWMFLGAIALLAIGLPIMLVTGHHERQRALARTTGAVVTTPANSAQRWFTWRKSLMGGGLAFAGLAFAVSGYATMRAMGIGPAGTLITTGVLEERGLLIVAEFDDRTPEANVAESVTEAFRIDLSQSPIVRLVDASAIQQSLARMNREAGTTVDVSLAREIAQREGAEALVVGDVGMLGTSFVISVRLLAAGDGAELLALRDRADDAAALVDAVDRLSAKLRERIGESLKTIRAGAPLARVTTSSLEALRLYTRSGRAQDDGDWERAIGLLEEALTHDSTFAMAYRRLGVILSNRQRERSRINAAATRAFELRDRLPPVERYLATAYFYGQVVPDPDKNIEAYQSVLEIDPENKTALNNLGVRFWSRRRWTEAEALFRQAIAQGAIWQNYNGLVAALVAQGRWEDAESTQVEFDRWGPGNPRAIESRVWLAAARHDYATADSAVLALQEAGARATHFRAVLYEVRGQLADAERVAARRVADALREGNGLDVLRWAVWPIRHEVRYRDAPEVAVRRLETVLERYPLDMAAAADRPYAAMADIYAAAGRTEVVRRLRGEWEAAATRGVANLYEWDGTVAIAERRYADAIAAYRAAFEEVWFGSTRRLYGLASAYDLSGEPDSALVVYERVITRPDRGRLGGEFDRLGPAYKRLGELYEARGDREKAVEYYSGFVDLWQGADEELQPVVRDVRGRIARLIGEQGR